ncbi:cellulose biosynthesis protein BcsN [Pelagibacterium sp.]|uniref:cellulose biosynthesis protein BcsN n=1 Tax=Pelagibacterium sp. TaxID=1967288 RepID=UPI003A9092E4
MVHYFAHAQGQGIKLPTIKAHPAQAKRFASFGAMIATAVLLAACSTTQVQTPRTATTVPLHEAMVFPPPGGPAMISVVETNYANAVRQEIALASNARTPGENHLTITRFLTRGGDGNFGELGDPIADNQDLYTEASAAFPEVSMLVSPFYVQNYYGPFGYAVGGAPTGDKCVYARQRIEPATATTGRVTRGSVVIRMQLCDRTSSERALLDMMFAMRLRDPVFQPWRASPIIGTPGAIILPQTSSGFQNVLDLPEAQPPRSTTRPAPVAQAATPSSTATTPPPLPQPSGPIVPLPGGGTAGSGANSNSTVVVPAPPGSS